MDRKQRKLKVLAGGTCLAGLAAILAACTQGPALNDRPDDPGQARFDARALIAIADADMAATAYADGVLFPQEGTRDHLLSITGVGPEAVVSWTPASNSVMGWPGALDVSPDGRFAYVVETKGPAEPGVAAYDDLNAGMPNGATLTTIDLTDLANPQSLGVVDVGPSPNAVHVEPEGRFALISVKDAAQPLTVVVLDNGRPAAVRRLAFPIAQQPSRAGDEGAIYVRLSPDGRRFAINIGNEYVQLGRLNFDEAGLPVGAEAIGEPLRIGRWLSVLRWSPDGGYIIAADVGWGASNLGAVLNREGSLLALRAEETGLSLASEAAVSLSPEAIEFAPSGDLLVAVNMERTYLPNRLPYSLFGRRDRSSLSLVSFNAETGALTTVDGPLSFEGVLPEDAAFDVDGDMLAVAVYQGHEGESAEAGWVALFRVDRTGETPRLIPTGQRIPTGRGLHDFVLLR